MTFFLLLLLHVPVRTSISYLCKSYPGVVCFISRASLIRTVFVSSLVPSQFTTQLPPLFCLPLVHNLGSLFSSPPLSLPFFAAKWLPISQVFLSTLDSTMSQRIPLDIVQSTMQTKHVSRQLPSPLLRVSTPNTQKNASKKSTDAFALSS